MWLSNHNLNNPLIIRTQTSKLIRLNRRTTEGHVTGLWSPRPAAGSSETDVWTDSCTPPPVQGPSWPVHRPTESVPPSPSRPSSTARYRRWYDRYRPGAGRPDTGAGTYRPVNQHPLSRRQTRVSHRCHTVYPEVAAEKTYWRLAQSRFIGNLWTAFVTAPWTEMFEKTGRSIRVFV